MKLITYSIFRGNEPLLFNFYLRGLYFNARMNRLIYPDWITHIEIERSVFVEYEQYFNELKKLFGVSYSINETAPRCEAMLWRLKPIWYDGVEKVLCRDADAITTWRERDVVEAWLATTAICCGINDNPVHSIPMMGGMIGFKCHQFKQITGYNSINDIIKSAELSIHGSDQDLLGKAVYPFVQNSIYISKNPIQYTDNPLWESNLTCRFIGSPGVVDMELIRFFKRFDKYDYYEFEKQYPKLFYWNG